MCCVLVTLCEYGKNGKDLLTYIILCKFTVFTYGYYWLKCAVVGIT